MKVRRSLARSRESGQPMATTFGISISKLAMALSLVGIHAEDLSRAGYTIHVLFYFIEFTGARGFCYRQGEMDAQCLSYAVHARLLTLIECEREVEVYFDDTQLLLSRVIYALLEIRGWRHWEAVNFGLRESEDSGVLN